MKDCVASFDYGVLLGFVNRCSEKVMLGYIHEALYYIRSGALTQLTEGERTSNFVSGLLSDTFILATASSNPSQ